MNVIERIRAREQRKLNRIKAAKQATPVAQEKPKKKTTTATKTTTTAKKSKAVVVEPPTPPVAEEIDLPEEPVG